MENLFKKLEWKSYQSELNITELDKYAEYTFDNGIHIKVSTGEMTHTTKHNPYELHILHPKYGRTAIPNLNEDMLNRYMNDFFNEIIN